MSIVEKLHLIQQELNAPKGQYNNFGSYHYRSLEDILTAVKPLLKQHQLALTLSDTIEGLGDRLYVKALARLLDLDNNAIEVTAFAREDESRPKFDGPQLTGSSSSYARKYALNGLFAIDDTKDSDATNKGDSKPAAKKATPKKEKEKTAKQIYDEAFAYIGISKNKVSAVDAVIAKYGEKFSDSQIKKLNALKGVAQLANK